MTAQPGEASGIYFSIELIGPGHRYPASMGNQWSAQGPPQAAVEATSVQTNFLEPPEGGEGGWESISSEFWTPFWDPFSHLADI